MFLFLVKSKRRHVLPQGDHTVIFVSSQSAAAALQPRQDRLVLPKPCSPRLAVTGMPLSSGNKAAHEALAKRRFTVGQSIRRIEEHLGEWLNGGTLTSFGAEGHSSWQASAIVLDFANVVLRESEVFLERLYAFQNSTQVRLACIHSGWMTYGAQWLAENRKAGTGRCRPTVVAVKTIPKTWRLHLTTAMPF